MRGEFVEALVTVATAIVGVAMLSVLVSRRSNTSDVIQASGSAFSNALAVAEDPVTGNGVSIVTAYPSETEF
ncbi:DNA delivery protein [Gluconobacter phage GC1]|uniref:DNA delivery protein n=1 Tax=Gluconobacter phage GC1 TaxID=2047788 RepID=A0A2I5AR71_9VIRU|nr:membrane DNA delivery [Gluconobacter phage GC1]ATS92586.1 DNA delivery protein [Gluconobacter phage GC1]